MHSLHWSCHSSSNTISGPQNLSTELFLKYKTSQTVLQADTTNEFAHRLKSICHPFYRIKSKLLRPQQSVRSMFPITGPHASCLSVQPQAITTLSCFSVPNSNHYLLFYAQQCAYSSVVVFI